MLHEREGISADLPEESEERGLSVNPPLSPSKFVEWGEGEPGRIILGLIAGLGVGGLSMLLDIHFGGLLMFLWMFVTGWIIGWAMRLSVRHVVWELDLLTWRFGLPAAGTAGTIAVFLDVCSAWFLYRSQVNSAEMISLRTVLELFRTNWRFWHLLFYGLAAVAAYLNSYLHLPWKARFLDASPPTGRNLAANRHQVRPRSRLQTLVKLVPPVLGVCGFIALTPLVIDRTSILDLSMSPEGQALAVVSGKAKGGGQIYNLSAALSVRQLPYNPQHIAWTADGEWLACAKNFAGSKESSSYAELHLVHRSTNADPPGLTLNALTIHSLAFSPDGQILAMGSDQGDVLLWHTDQPRITHRLAHDQPVCGLAFSPTTGTLAAGLSDGRIAVWNLDRPTPLQTWQAHSTAICRLQYHPQREVLFSASTRDDMARAWETSSGKEIKRYPLDMDWTTGLTVAPDGRTLAVFGGSFHRSGEVRLFDSDSGEVRRVFAVASNTVTSAAFSGGGQTLFAGTLPPLNPLIQPRNGQIYRWDVATGEELPALQ